MRAGSSDPQPDAKPLNIVKFFTSVKWKAKFADIATQFDIHKSDLQSDLQLHTSVTVTKTHELVASVDEKINNMNAMIELVFSRMQTPEERSLATFAQRSGGLERVLENADLMKVALETHSAAANDDKSSTSGKGKGGAPTRTKLTLAQAEKEIRRDVDTVLEENTRTFERKFGAIELSLREVNVTIERQSDRVISTVLAGMHAGPHERIKDQVRSPGVLNGGCIKQFPIPGLVQHLERDGKL